MMVIIGYQKAYQYATISIVYIRQVVIYRYIHTLLIIFIKMECVLQCFRPDWQLASSSVSFSYYPESLHHRREKAHQCRWRPTIHYLKLQHMNNFKICFLTGHINMSNIAI